LGTVGVYAFLAATLAAAVSLAGGSGIRVLPGTVVLLAAGWSFIDSHIFSPRGVLTMLAMSAGFALLTWATVRRCDGVPVGTVPPGAATPKPGNGSRAHG
ncbi:MAG: hypothetical protein SYR96_39665, partial [Actinomycetota bacterium]|nr:hypothetical protein [Actinomycetota bacterium]